MPKPSIEILASADTEIGKLELTRRRFQFDPGQTFIELLVEGRMLMSDYNTLSERALAHEGVVRCSGDGLRVLVGGLGLGHTAHEALMSQRVAMVDVIEYVPQIVSWFESGLMTLSTDLREDSRFRVIQDDVYARLSEPATELYDLLLIDVDHAPDDPLTDDSASFYTADGLRRVSRHLEPGGVLAVWSYIGNERFEATLREVFDAVETQTTVFQDEIFGGEDETNCLFFASEPRPQGVA